MGGESANCVLSAHSGMSAQRMFDDVRLLEEGDVFVIWTLGDPYAYEVSGSEVVLPEEVEGLFVEGGKDQVTLVTCTPYGVNSHRLLVHAQRTDYVPEDMPRVLNGIYYNSRMRPLLIGIAIVVAAGVVLFVWRRFRKARQNAAAAQRTDSQRIDSRRTDSHRADSQRTDSRRTN